MMTILWRFDGLHPRRLLPSLTKGRPCVQVVVVGVEMMVMRVLLMLWLRLRLLRFVPG
jgi:hypothetical protein